GIEPSRVCRTLSAPPEARRVPTAALRRRRRRRAPRPARGGVLRLRDRPRRDVAAAVRARPDRGGTWKHSLSRRAREPLGWSPRRGARVAPRRRAARLREPAVVRVAPGGAHVELRRRDGGRTLSPSRRAR